jgi:hypothetical protein
MALPSVSLRGQIQILCITLLDHGEVFSLCKVSYAFAPPGVQCGKGVRC